MMDYKSRLDEPIKDILRVTQVIASERSEREAGQIGEIAKFVIDDDWREVEIEDWLKSQLVNETTVDLFQQWQCQDDPWSDEWINLMTDIMEAAENHIIGSQIDAVFNLDAFAERIVRWLRTLEITEDRVNLFQMIQDWQKAIAEEHKLDQLASRLGVKRVKIDWPPLQFWVKREYESDLVVLLIGDKHDEAVEICDELGIELKANDELPEVKND